MTGRFVTVVALGWVALAVGEGRAQFRGPRGGDPAARYGWLPGLEDGKARARVTGKPLMVMVRCVP